MDDSFNYSVFSKNKARLLEHQVSRELLGKVIEEARQRHLLSEEHFTVDGTLLEAWASLKSFHPKDEGKPPSSGEKNPYVNFHGQQRTNETHE